MAKQHLITAQGVIRPGEGHVIDLTVLASDSETTLIQLDASSLPVPDRKFSCDAAQVLPSNQGVRILLAQRQPIGEGLLAMLVIKMAADNVGQLLRSTSDQFVAGANEFLDKHRCREVTSVFTENAAQSVVVTASYTLAGYTGFNACMDCYSVSPFSMQNMAALKKMALEPVVRVQLSTGLLIAVIDDLRKRATELGWSLAGVRNAGV